MNELTLFKLWSEVTTPALFAVFARSREERRYFRVSLAERAKAGNSQVQISALEAPYCADHKSTFGEPQLFAAARCLLIDEVQTGPAALELVRAALENARGFRDRRLRIALLGSAPPQSALWRRLQPDARVLDLRSEKPWEREERWRRGLQARAQDVGCRLTPRALEALIARCKESRLLAEQEIDRLATLSTGGGEVDEGEVLASVSPVPQEAFWPFIRAVERLDWPQALHELEQSAQVLTPHALSAGLRNWLREALMALDKEGAVSAGEQSVTWEMKKQARLCECAERVGRERLKNWIFALAEIDAECRMGDLPPEALLRTWAYRCFSACQHLQD